MSIAEMEVETSSSKERIVGNIYLLLNVSCDIILRKVLLIPSTSAPHHTVIQAPEFFQLTTT